MFLSGSIVSLKPIEITQHTVPDYLSWINDQDTTKYMGSGRWPLRAKELLEYIDNFSNGMLLGIYINNHTDHIGNITLQQIDWRNGLGEIGIIVGKESSRGRGYGTEALRLIIDHAFNRMNLRKLHAGVVVGNDPSVGLFEKAGFQIEGTLREHFYLNGEYLDVYKMGLIRGSAVDAGHSASA